MGVKRKSAKPKAKMPSGKAAVINKYAKSSGMSKAKLSKVYSRGLGRTIRRVVGLRFLRINGLLVE